MSDHSLAALCRIREFADDIVYEAEGVYLEGMSEAVGALLSAAQLLRRVADDVVKTEGV